MKGARPACLLRGESGGGWALGLGCRRLWLNGPGFWAPGLGGGRAGRCPWYLPGGIALWEAGSESGRLSEGKPRASEVLIRWFGVPGVECDIWE